MLSSVKSNLGLTKFQKDFFFQNVPKIFFLLNLNSNFKPLSNQRLDDIVTALSFAPLIPLFIWAAK